MGFLKKIGALLFGSANGELKDPDGIYLYIKCAKCGSPVRIRADKRHDLQRNYDTGQFTLRKEVMDGTCFQLIYANVQFDSAYNIIDQEVTGGEFISWDEYQALTQPVADDEAPED